MGEIKANKNEIGRIVLFDGVCALCNRTVQFLLKRDKHGVLKFAPLQGSTAAAILQRHPEITENSRSVILVQNYATSSESISIKSQAVLDCLSALGGFWRVLSLLRIIPPFVRNAVYIVIATNRYKWLGKNEECFVPSANWQDRFLQ